MKTQKGVLTRPIQKLHSLELVQTHDKLPNIVKEDNNERDVTQILSTPTYCSELGNTKVDNNTEIKTRYGRTVKHRRDENFVYNT